MKTLHITNAWHPTSGGVATFYRRLIDAAERENRLLRLVVPAERTSVENLGRFTRIYHVAAPRAPLNSAYRILYPHLFLLPGGAIHKILQDEQPGLIEVCDKYTLPYLAALLRVGAIPGLKFRPVVVGLSCERLDVNFAIYATAGRIGSLFSRLYMKWVYFPQFDHHIAVSEQTAGELQPASRGHKVARSVWVAPMGVDLERYSPAQRSEEARRELARRAGVPSDAVLLLYAGRLAPEKNLELLLGMMERLSAQPDRDYRLLIAGTGCSEAQFQTEAERRVPWRVRFLGHIAGTEELAKVYANSDVFVHPNPREPFGLAPLESMASGLPLVAPNTGGVTTYAGAKNAWLAAPTAEAFSEAVYEVLGDAEATRERCAAARATAAEYRWEKVTADYLRLYEELYELGRGQAVQHARPPQFVSTQGNWLGLESRRRFMAILGGVIAGMAMPAKAAAPVARRYRADATIMLLSIPIYSRAGVGGANVAIEERGATGNNRVGIQFAAGSFPERAAGVNRLGFIREIVTERGAVAEDARYLGFMTSSDEEDLDAAKESLKRGAGETVSYTAIEGAAGLGRFRNRVIRTEFAARYKWNDWPELTRSIEEVFNEGGAKPDSGSLPGRDARTFLFTVYRAIADSRREFESTFLYNGKRYRLSVRKESDAGMGKRLASRKLTAAPGRIMKLDGRMTELAARTKSDFRLWYDPESEMLLPIRFEFRARSFLRLAFEQDASVDGAAMNSLFPQENT